MIAEYLDKNKIILNLKSITFKQALKKMLKVSDERTHSQIINKLMERESLMATALGKGVALPRTVITNKQKTEIIIATSPKGIKVRSFDLLPVKIVFLYLISEKDNYASILAQGLRLLNEDGLRTEFLNCKTGEELIEIIKKWEEE
jgi:mannitol/fructose-specific phosphotransferase system IIA component (Ntr-type)